MAFFRRDSEKQLDKREDREYDDPALEFPFHVLWEDEEGSNFVQYIFPIIQIILLIWILIKK